MRSASANRVLAVGALLGTALLLSACDSGGEEDGDLFVGTWRLTGLEINGENQMVLLTLVGVESMDVTFSADGDFELDVVTDSGSTATRGSYVLDEETITLTSDAFDQPLVLDYEASGSNRIVLTSVDATLLSEISGVDLSELGIEVERVDVTISRQE
jgi:hypothetical protein